MPEKIYLKSESNHKISAIFSRPIKKSKTIVIMCHGLNSGKDSLTNIELEKIFLQNNVAVLRFDFFAHGESEGNKEYRSVKEFVDNVQKAIDYVKGLGYNNIGLYGASFGGVAATIVASKNSDLKVMALKAVGMGQTSRRMPQYKVDFENKSWIKAGEKVKIPTSVIHGASDEDVEVELGKELAKSIKGSKFKLYAGTDHRFTKKNDFERMIKNISEFIIKHLHKERT